MPIAFSKKDLSTTTWFSLEKLVNLITAVFIIPQIFNALGTVDMGKLKLAESVLGMFLPIFSLGLSAICVREFVFKPHKSHAIMATAFVMRFISWGLVFIGLIGYLWVTGSASLFIIYLSLTVGYLFKLTDIFEYYLLAKKQAKSIFIVKIISLFIVVLLQYYGIKQQLPVTYFAQVIAIDFLLQGLLYLLILSLQKTLKLRQWRFNVALGKQLLKMGFPLLVSEALVMIYIGIDELALKYFHGDHANGVFGSVQFLVIDLSWVIGFAAVNAIYPSLAQSFKAHKNTYIAKTKQLALALIVFGLGIALIYTFFGGAILSAFFSKQYEEAKTALLIFCWAPMFVFIGLIYEKHLLTTNRLKHNVYRFMVGCITNLLLCSLLVPQYGVNGAAVAVLISHFITNIGYIAFDAVTRQQLKAYLRL